MVSLKLLMAIALVLGLGTTGIAAVTVGAGAASNFSGALSTIGTSVGLNVSSPGGAQSGGASLGAATKNTTTAQLKTGGQKKSNPSVGLSQSLAPTTTVTATETLTGSLKIATAIATTFGVSVTQILDLRKTDWGWGEIVKLYELAQESGTPIADIEKMRESGEGWGEIARDLSVSLSGPNTNLGSILSGRGAQGQGKSQGQGKGRGGK